MPNRHDLTVADASTALPPPSLVSGEDAVAAAHEAEQAAVPVEEGEFTLVPHGAPE